MVFVDEDKEILEKIQYVEYLLHPTFPNPRKLAYDRESRFALRSAGWGEFTIKAMVHFTDGKTEQVKHSLDFGKKWPEIPPAKAKGKRQLVLRSVATATAIGEMRQGRLQFEIFKVEEGGFSFRLVGTGGAVLTSDEEYETKEMCMEAIDRLKRSILEATIVKNLS
jgi:transcription initiation factor IIF auxiliary subunit